MQKKCKSKMQEKCRWKSAVCIFSHFSCILPRFLHFASEIMFVQLVPGLICIFFAFCLHLFRFLFAFVCFLPRFCNFFQDHFVQLVSRLICIVFAVFLHFSLLRLSELHFSIVFFFLFLPLPDLHFSIPCFLHYFSILFKMSTS